MEISIFLFYALFISRFQYVKTKGALRKPTKPRHGDGSLHKHVHSNPKSTKPHQGGFIRTAPSLISTQLSQTKTEVKKSLVSTSERDSSSSCANTAYALIPYWTGSECDDDTFLCIEEGLFSNCCKCRPECCGQCGVSTVAWDPYQPCAVRSGRSSSSSTSSRSSSSNTTLAPRVGSTPTHAIIAGAAIFVVGFICWAILQKQRREQKVQDGSVLTSKTRIQKPGSKMYPTGERKSLFNIATDFDKIKARREALMKRRKDEHEAVLKEEEAKELEQERLQQEEARKQAEEEAKSKQEQSKVIDKEAIERRVAAARARQKGQLKKEIVTEGTRRASISGSNVTFKELDENIQQRRTSQRSAEWNGLINASVDLLDDDALLETSQRSQHMEVRVLKVTVVKGRGFQIERKAFGFKDIPDVYCVVKFGDDDKEWRTKTIQDNVSPVWNETERYIMNDDNQKLSVEVWDANSKGEDDYYGNFHVAIGRMMYSDGTLELELKNQGRSTGMFITLSCEVLEIDTTDLNRQSVALKNLRVSRAQQKALVGSNFIKWVKITIESGRGFRSKIRSLVKDIPDIYCIVKCGSNSRWKTETIMDSKCPEWNESESFIMDSTKQLIEVEVWDQNEWSDDEMYGSFKVEVGKVLLNDGAIEMEATSKSGKPRGIFIRLGCKVQAMPRTSVLTVPFIEPNSNVRLHVLNGRGFQEQKKHLGLTNDIPDVYCILKVEGTPKVWQTSTIKDDVAPEWDESEVYEINNQHQLIKIFAFDANKNGDDELYGTGEVSVSKLLASPDSVEVELKNNGVSQGLFIALLCELEDEDSDEN